MHMTTMIVIMPTWICGVPIFSSQRGKKYDKCRMDNDVNDTIKTRGYMTILLRSRLALLCMIDNNLSAGCYYST